MSCTEARNRTNGTTTEFVKTDTEHVPRWPNFFDGRVLTADVMRSQREAVREHLGYLGLAVGPGVAEGFTVLRRGATGLDVAAGTAINGSGSVLHLEEGITLTIPTPDEAARQRALFAACRREPGEEVEAAVFVLTARPCEAYRDRDPRVSNGTGGTGILGCGYKWLMEGIAFELLELPAGAPQDAEDPRFRNLLAFWCHHGDSLWSGEPWRWSEGIRVGEGGVDGLTAAHVPLAVVAWDGTRIVTLDMWAARREPGAPAPAEAWSGLAGQAAARLGRARFLGFQAFLEEEFGTKLDVADVAPGGRCRFLPPAWLFRLAPGSEAEKDARVRQGVTPEVVRLAVERSFLADPLDLDAPDASLLRSGLPFEIYPVAAGKTDTPWFLAVKPVRGVLPSAIPEWVVW